MLHLKVKLKEFFSPNLLLFPFAFYLLPFTFYLLPFTLYPLPFTLYPLPFTLYPLPFALYPLPFTLYPLLFCLYPLPYVTFCSKMSDFSIKCNAKQCSMAWTNSRMNKFQNKVHCLSYVHCTLILIIFHFIDIFFLKQYTLKFFWA